MWSDCKLLKMLLLLSLLLILAVCSTQTLESPCPDILTYEESRPEDRWFGKITFPAGSSPHWLFLTVVLDKKADMLGNWLGEVTTNDNMLYKIVNTEMKKTKPTGLIRFFVKHDPEDEAPRVQIIKIDGREICNAEKPTTQNVQKPDLNQHHHLQSAPGIRYPVSPGSPSSPDNSANTDSPANFARSAKLESAADSATPANLDRADTIDHANFRIPINFYTNDEQQCGQVKLKNPVGLVVNGAPTQEGQWPWHIALYRTEKVNHYYICGGTLVSRKHVITAAHCTTVRNTWPAQKVFENSLIVYLGLHDLVTSPRGTWQTKFVEKITNHPEYEPRTFSRDISILLLHEPVEFTFWVQPACLWPDYLVALSHIVDKKGSVVGWGNDGSGQLTLVEMPVVDQETCLRSGTNFYLRITSGFTYCAGSRNGMSACNGDSGGGMMFEISGSWYLRGLVSVAPARNNEPVCDPEQYVVFTDIAKLLPWVRENINE